MNPRGNEHPRVGQVAARAYPAPAALDVCIESHEPSRRTKATVRSETALRKRPAEIRKHGYAVEQSRPAPSP
ncbi:hypothetical protein [Actinomadura sp. WMMA1423]|uniref:hypothetical protein n=1 Tax=Actinomadura sp. WMMA1423 TaxID=2591108 RepID=UPI0011471E06|nr:hypothetical protein [Actinomadura sp. WMMA1423]